MLKAIPIIILAGCCNMLSLGEQFLGYAKAPSGVIWYGTSAGGILSQNYLGIGRSFTDSYIKQYHPENIIVLQCSGTNVSVEDWQKGKPLYEACIQELRVIQSQTTVPTKPVVLLFWADEMDSYKQRPWARFFTTFVKHFRSSIGDKSLPVLFCQRTIHLKENVLNQVHVMREEESVDVPGVSMIKTTGTLLRDPVHVDGSSLEKIGKAIFEKYNYDHNSNHQS